MAAYISLFCNLVRRVLCLSVCRPGCLAFDGVVLQLDPLHAQQAFDEVVDIHHKVAITSKWSSVWERGVGILPILEQCQQVVPPHLTVLLEAHGSAAPGLFWAFG